MTNISDDSLAIAAASGDTEAFARIYDRYAPKIALVLRSYAQDQADLEDLVHDAFCRIIHGLRSYKPRGLFHAWAMAIAVNSGRKHVRHRHRTLIIHDPTALETLFRVTQNPEDSHTNRLLAENLIRNLSEPKRIVMVLRFWLDYSYAEISDILEIPQGTARRRVHTALQEIRASLAAVDHNGKEICHGTEI